MLSQTKYRAGLVGAGHICEYHIAALRRLPNVEIMGIHDTDLPRAMQTGEKLGVAVAPSMDRLRESGANVIHILTPPHTHAQLALKALDLGCHVLIEKPLAVDVADCLRIQAKAQEKGLQVCVDHSLLFDPQVKRALDWVREGKLGKIVSMDILRGSVYPPYAGGPLPPQYRTAGYPFRDLGVHALYLFQAFLGPIEYVYADWASLGGEPNLAYDEWRAQVRCRDGMGQFQLSWNVKPLQSQMIIQGTRAVLRVDLFSMFSAMRVSSGLPKPIERMVNVYTDSAPPMIESPRNAVRFLRGQIRQYHGLQDLVAAFYRSLEHDAPVPVSISEAVPVVQWTEEIARAADRDFEQHLSDLAARNRELSISNETPILVTGASGGLGSAIVERLLAMGRPVRIFVRRAPRPAPPNVEIVIGDLGDPEAVERAVRGICVVIHAGAAMRGDWTEHNRATVLGTQNILTACRKHGVAKLVHISSLSVVDWAGAKRGAPISESTPHEPHAEMRGSYTRAKLEAEQLVTQGVREDGLPAVIIRPGQIFGGKLPLLTPAIARKSGKRWIVLGDGRLPLPLVYIDDVVDAIVLAADGTHENGEIIQLVDPVSLTQADVLKRAFGTNANIVHIPRPMVFLMGRLSEVILGLLGRQSPMSVYRLKSALARRSFTSDAGEKFLGWQPKVGVDEGIRRALSSEKEASL